MCGDVLFLLTTSKLMQPLVMNKLVLWFYDAVTAEQHDIMATLNMKLLVLYGWVFPPLVSFNREKGSENTWKGANFTACT